MEKISFNKIHRSRRLIIRPYKISDYSSWHTAMRSRHSPKNKFDQGPPTEEKLARKAFQARLSRYNTSAKNDAFYVYGIFDRKTGEHIGSVDLYVIQRAPM